MDHGGVGFQLSWWNVKMCDTTETVILSPQEKRKLRNQKYQEKLKLLPKEEQGSMPYIQYIKYDRLDNCFIWLKVYLIRIIIIKLIKSEKIGTLYFLIKKSVFGHIFKIEIFRSFIYEDGRTFCAQLVALLFPSWWELGKGLLKWNWSVMI